MLNELPRWIAGRIRSHRLDVGLSIAELADASGMCSETLERVEERREDCAASDLWLIAQALDVPISDFWPPALKKAPSEPRSFIALSASGLDAIPQTFDH